MYTLEIIHKNEIQQSVKIHYTTIQQYNIQQYNIQQYNKKK
jgi:hypothetical protein